jgi:hypothetical protein
MVQYNLTPFAAAIDDPNRLKHMSTVKTPLQTVYDGKVENLRLHIQDFIRRIQNTGSIKNSLSALKKILAPPTLRNTYGHGIIPFAGKQPTSWKTLMRSPMTPFFKKKIELRTP